MKKFMRVCLSMFLAIVIVFSNCSFAAVTNSLAKNTYLQLEKKNIKSIEKVLSQSKNFFDTNVNTSRETIEVYSENFPDDVKLKVIEEFDKGKNYQYDRITLGTNETEKLSVDMVLKDNVLMLQVPELYEKYISIDFSKAKEICEKFGIELDSEQINQLTNIISNVGNKNILSKEDEAYLAKVLPKYVKKLNSLMDSKHFSMNSNAKITYGDKSLNCKSVSYEMTGKDMYDALYELLKEVRNDEKLLDIFVSAMNSTGKVNINKESMLEDIDFMISQLDLSQSTGETEELEEVKLISTLYYNSKKETLKREIKVKNSFDEEQVISLVTIDGNKDAYYELNYDGFKIVDKVVKTSKKTEHNISVIETKIAFYENTYFNREDIVGTEQENRVDFKIMVETPSKSKTVITGLVEGLDDKIIIEINEKVTTSKKLDYSFTFTYDTLDVDYKVFVNYYLEKGLKISQKTFENPEISIDKMSYDELAKELEDNREIVSKKAESLLRELFPQAINKMEAMAKEAALKAEKATGAQIGKGVRIYDRDMSLDYGISDRVTNSWIEYSKLENIDWYIYSNAEPKLENGRFYVCKNSDDQIIVGVSNNGGADLPNADDVLEADYDGTKSGIVYIEGRIGGIRVDDEV